MPKTIIAEGKTTNEAIEKGLKELKMSKDKVEIKVLENAEKRSFFSILAPRVVRVELTVKEEVQHSQEKRQEKVSEKPKKEIILSKDEQEKAKENVEKFLEEFVKQLQEDTTYDIKMTEKGLDVSINNPDLGYLIGYRGETLYALQTILSAVASKGVNDRVRVILDIEGYKEKRQKTLEELAEKIAKTVVKNRKSITLEPMQAYERKIIHSKLQNNSRVETRSIGEEPNRRIVIEYKNK